MQIKKQIGIDEEGSPLILNLINREDIVGQVGQFYGVDIDFFIDKIDSAYEINVNKDELHYILMGWNEDIKSDEFYKKVKRFFNVSE